MLLDRCDRLKDYYPLDEKLRDIVLNESVEIPEFNGFLVDKSRTYLFTVNKGSALFATSWRENPSSRETTGVIGAKHGEFVLYLPGEPILVKIEEGSEVSLFRSGE